MTNIILNVVLFIINSGIISVSIWLYTYLLAAMKSENVGSIFDSNSVLYQATLWGLVSACILMFMLIIIFIILAKRGYLSKNTIAMLSVMFLLLSFCIGIFSYMMNIKVAADIKNQISKLIELVYWTTFASTLLLGFQVGFVVGKIGCTNTSMTRQSSVIFQVPAAA